MRYPPFSMNLESYRFLLHLLAVPAWLWLFWIGAYELALGAVLFGEPSSPDVWPEPSTALAQTGLTVWCIALVWYAAPHWTKWIICPMMAISAITEMILLFDHVETVYNEWSLGFDALWLFVLIRILIRPVPKNAMRERGPSIEYIS